MMLLEPQFADRLNRLALQPPHAILLQGIRQFGAAYEAHYLAELIIKNHTGVLQTITQPADKQVITIEQIQSLYRSTRSKHHGSYSVWLINDAEKMSESAQNAFLKLLEEPPENTVFILETSGEQPLLHTVRSRCTVLHSTPFEAARAIKWLKEQGIADENELRQLLFLAEGSPSELAHLAQNTDYRADQLHIAADAKQLVSKKGFEVIELAAKVAGDRDKALRMLHIAMQILMTLASQDPKPAYTSRLEVFLQVYEQLTKNGNVRLQVLRLVS